MLTSPTNSFLYYCGFVGCCLCATLGKNRSRNATVKSARRQTDKQTDGNKQGQRQTEFIIGVMLYAIAMGQIKTSLLGLRVVY